MSHVDVLGVAIDNVLRELCGIRIVLDQYALYADTRQRNTPNLYQQNTYFSTFARVAYSAPVAERVTHSSVLENQDTQASPPIYQIPETDLLSPAVLA